MQSADLYPDDRFPDTGHVAFDSEEIIGRVYRIDRGKDEGRWFWSMTASRPGPSFNARSGTEARRGDAGRRMVEASEAMLARIRGWKPAPEDDDEA
jgi:hypothetical protein